MTRALLPGHPWLHFTPAQASYTGWDRAVVRETHGSQEYELSVISLYLYAGFCLFPITPQHAEIY